MAIFVLIMGVLLSIAGLAGYVYGVDMLPTERGIAATISSVTAFAGGIVTIALGAVIQRLDRLLSLPQRVAEPLETMSAEASALSQPVILPVPARPVVPVQASVDAIAQELAMPVPPEPALSLTPAPAPADVAKPGFAAPEIAAPEPVAAIPEPVKKERFKVRLPASLKLGGAAASAGAVAAAASYAESTAQEAAKPQTQALEMQTPETHQSEDQRLEGHAPGIDEVQDANSGPDAPTGNGNDAVKIDGETPVEALPTPDDSYAAIFETSILEVRPPDASPPEAMSELEAELEKLIPLKSFKPASRSRKERQNARVVEQEPAPALKPAEETPAEPAPVVIPERAPEVEIPTSILAEPEDMPVPQQALPAAGAEIVGSYESGGARYTMYSDGSVRADMGADVLYFESLEKLREFIDAGGAKG